MPTGPEKPTTTPTPVPLSAPESHLFIWVRFPIPQHDGLLRYLKLATGSLSPGATQTSGHWHGLTALPQMPTIFQHIDGEQVYCIDADGHEDIYTPKRKSAMIMRITWGKLNPGTWDEFEQKYKETLAGKEIKGLKGRWLAQDMNDPDGGFSLSLWETVEDMHAYEQSEPFRDMYVPAMRPFFAGEYTTYHCDVKYFQ